MGSQITPDEIAISPQTAQSKAGQLLRDLLRSLCQPDRAIALGEQGLLAGVRLAALLVFARIMAPEAFGAFALVVSISFILNNIQRSVVILPFIISSQKTETAATAVREWWWIDVFAAAAVGLLLLSGWGLAVLVAAPNWVQTALVYSAIGAPPLMLYTFLRRVDYQAGAYRNILSTTGTYVAAYVAGIIAAFVFRELEYLPFLAFAAAPTAGMLFGMARILKLVGRPSVGVWGSLGRSFEFTSWSFLSFLVGTIYTNGMNIIVAGFIGVVGSAMFTATRTLVAPVVTLTTAVDMVDKPRAGRAFAKEGIDGLRRSVRHTLVALLVLGVPYLLVIATFSDAILEFAYGAKYAHLVTELRLWALAMFLNMVANPFATHFITLRNSRTIFFCAAAGALVALAVAIPLLAHLGVVAALLGMTGGRLANTLLLFFAVRRQISRERSSSLGAAGYSAPDAAR